MAVDPPAPERSWRTRIRAAAGTVRVRITAAAVLVVGVALLAGGVLFIALLRDSLTRQVEFAARVHASDVATAIHDGAPAALAVTRDDEELIQVLDADGRVIASSRNVAGRAPVARLRPGGAEHVQTPVDDDPFVAVAVAGTTPHGPVTVVVARALVDVVETVGLVTRLLTVGLPLLLALMALITWRAVGRALSPVEAIRAEVDGISAAQLHRRVPVPPGRDEIARLAGTMNRMLERLQRTHRGQRQFISDASHELRSPVATIRQHAELALAHPELTTSGSLAETVLAEDLRMQRLVDDLLLLAQTDEDSAGPRRRPVDLDDLVFAEGRRLRLSGDLVVDVTGVSAGRVSGDAGWLDRMVRNLGENAGRHATSRVSFSLARRATGVVLTVDDDGSGIPEEQRQRVFERFVRLDEARARGNGGLNGRARGNDSPDGGGSGLGLAIVAEVVAAHGGQVAVMTGPLGGARFVVTLPSADEAAPPDRLVLP